jgi:hypothetical protein
MSENPQRSDWSGALLEPDAPVEIVVELTDGSRRRVSVSAAEHERLSDAGVDVRGPRAKVLALLHARWQKAAAWALTAFAAVAIGQCTANHFADRQEELEIKSALATTISRAAVEAYDAALDVVNIGVEEHRRGPDVIRARDGAVKIWNSAKATVDPQMLIHLEGSDAEQHWRAYSIALVALANLSYAEYGPQRAERLSDIRAYLDEHPPVRPLAPPSRSDPLALLACDDIACSETDDWRDAYRWLGTTLKRQRVPLIRELLDTDAENLG